MSDLFDDFGRAQRKPSDESHKRVAAQRRKAQRKQRVRTTVVLAIVIALMTAVGYVIFPRIVALVSPPADYDGTGTQSVVVDIPDGATGSRMGAILFNSGVVASQAAFVDAFNDDARASAISSGKYNLKKEMSAKAAISALLDPHSRAEVKITIPEGSTIGQVRQIVAQDLGISEDEVATALKSPDVGLPPESGGQAEGWIEPLTYTVETKQSLTEVLAGMVQARIQHLTTLGVPREQWQRVLTLASIVERETFIHDDYTKVARVLVNRLSSGSETHGLLQMDSTVLYGQGKTSGMPTAADLAADNPYNTYKHRGLPPTPIGAASDVSIEAALHPAEGSWEYFVTVNLDTGETKFASTYEEHQKNVDQLKAWMAAHPERG
ncbi:MAG: endolytic transglycosylase MltG [Actinomycetaceae bacterium]|nr:endolytic transglycosylase MltG [Actinomycetaceae bacterium]MDY6083162.1 endolytic transglycosylase MltG [Actinomycetaceae bacterium]